MTVLRGRDIGRVGGVEGPRQGPSPAEWLRAEAELTPADQPAWGFTGFEHVYGALARAMAVDTIVAVARPLV